MSSITALWDDCELEPEKIDALLKVLQANRQDLQALRRALDTLLPAAAIEVAVAELDSDPSIIEHWEKELQLALSKTSLLAFLQWAQDGLQFCDVYCFASLAGVCTEMPQIINESHLWEPRVQFLSNCWLMPLSDSLSWKEQFFGITRPRWDGIYVGTCGYLHRITAGASLTDARRRMWIDYRRYLRLCPPDDTGVCRGLVLQDACPSDVAIDLLLSLDPQTHRASPAVLTGQSTGKDAKEKLAAKTMSCTYSFKDGHINLRWFDSEGGEYSASLKVGHRKDSFNFSEQLEWISYYLLNMRGDLTYFNLGRTPEGTAAKQDCEHFAPFYLRPCSTLTHLL